MKSISKKMTLFTVLLIIISLLVATVASVGIIYSTTKALTDQTLTENGYSSRRQSFLGTEINA